MHYIDAIVLSRHPAVTVDNIHDNADVVIGNPSDEEDDCVNDDSQEEMAKKLLDGYNNITQLKAIVAKEKIDIAPGKKNKTDYINAIYAARMSK